MNPLKLWLKIVFLGVFCSVVSAAEAQQARTLSSFLPSMNWDPAKSGSLIVVDSDNVRQRTDASTLQAFDCKLAVVGRLSAIVPDEMVLIDGVFNEPNMYDGLPMQAKVLYLLSTMSAAQVSLANTNGICERDLQGDQLKVMKSILPDPFAWQTVRVNDKGSYGADVLDHGVVPEDQMDQVRLKIQSGLVFDVSSQGQQNGYRPVNTGELLSKAGQVVTFRDSSDTPNAFGAKPKESVPNKLKGSQLKYEDSVFGRIIEIPAHATIDALLKQIGAATGIEIHAHNRVANLPVSILGSRVVARDLLKALALCVTGTYRRVGPAYVLTSDLDGIGARMLQYAAWKNSADSELRLREGAWRNQVLKSGTLPRIGFDPKDSLSPDSRIQALLNQVDDTFGTKVPVSQLTPAMQDYLNRYAAANPEAGFLLDRVGLHSQIQLSFVLPGGQPLRAERSNLSAHIMFHPPIFPQHNDPTDVEKYSPNPKTRHPLIVRAETDATARAAVDKARTHGFSEVWIETHSKSALLAAENQGVKVSLVIRPWRATDRDPKSLLDRNILGDSGIELGARRNEEPDWQRYQKIADGGGVGPPRIYDEITPSADGLERRWDALALLAHSPGLAGLVIMDSEPPGYEETDLRTHYAGYDRWLSALNEFGFSEATRLAFLREHQMDPIDIDWPEMFIDIDLDQPFFPDYAYIHDGRDNDASQDMRLMLEDWNKFRAKLNKKTSESLFSRLNDLSVPVMVMPRVTAIHLPPDMGLEMDPWIPGESFPVFDPQKRRDHDGGMLVFTLTEDSSTVATRDLGWHLKSDKFDVAVDMSSVKPDRLPILLDSWFPEVVNK